MNNSTAFFDTGQDGPNTVKTSLVMLLLLILGISIRLFISNGLLFDQSVESLSLAWQTLSSLSSSSAGTFLAHLKNVVVDLLQLPGGEKLIVPLISLIFGIFGVNQITGITFSMLSALFMIPILFILGKTMFNQAVGLVASFLWAILPTSVFLTLTYLSITPKILLSTLVVFLLIRAENASSRSQYFFAVIVMAIGLILDWTYLGSTLLFGMLFFMGAEDNSYLVKLRRFAIFAGLLMIVFPVVGANGVDLYYLALLLLENLILIPLLLITIVLVAKANSGENGNILLLWLGSKAIFLILASTWILGQPEISVIGMSGYWLDMLIPALILISWHLVEQAQPVRLVPIVLIISLMFLIGIGIVSLVGERIPTLIITISRIALGISFLVIPGIHLVNWNSATKTKLYTIPVFLILFSVATVVVSDSYAKSYSYLVEDPRSVIGYLTQEGGDATLSIAEDQLFDRFFIENKFELTQTHSSISLTIIKFSLDESNNIPSNTYVLTSENFKNFVLGIPPINWILIQEFRSSEEQTLLLYYVNPDS